MLAPFSSMGTIVFCFSTTFIFNCSQWQCNCSVFITFHDMLESLIIIYKALLYRTCNTNAGGLLFADRNLTISNEALKPNSFLCIKIYKLEAMDMHFMIFAYVLSNYGYSLRFLFKVVISFSLDEQWTIVLVYIYNLLLSFS